LRAADRPLGESWRGVWLVAVDKAASHADQTTL
jgi:hypothetical protein